MSLKFIIVEKVNNERRIQILKGILQYRTVVELVNIPVLVL